MSRLDVLYREFAGQLRAFYRNRAQGEDIEDLVHEVFLKVSRAPDDIEQVARVDAWLYRIARNNLVDYYRARGRRAAQLLEQEEPAAETPEQHDELNELVQGWLRPFAESLPDRYRDAVIWADFEGCSQSEVAERLGLSLSGAKSRVQRGRYMLRQRLLACCQIETDGEGNVVEVTPNDRCSC